MVKDTQTRMEEVVEKYREYTDKYFLRTRQILENEGINPYVRYQVFARKGGEVRGVNEAVQFIKEVTGNKAKIFALADGQIYSPCEPLMKIEGNVQDLVELETVYLGMISAGLTGDISMQEVKQRAGDIVRESQGKPVFYFGARHFHPTLDEKIAKICQEEGFIGASTDVGARAWNAKGIGTTPHALIVSYAAYLKENGNIANATAEAAKGFDKYVDKTVPRLMLIDTFNREIDDTTETAEAVPNLRGIRIDTCGENYAQGAKEIALPKLDAPEKYVRGKGVTLAAVWALRNALVQKELGNLELTVSSGFNAEKTKAFVEADRVFKEKFGYELFTNIGTGSIANPIMATADIVAYKNEKNQWIEMHKVGRPEIATERLQEIK